MTTHNCVRNPITGACYVCMTPMRLRFVAESKLDAIIDNTQFPPEQPTVTAPHCQCGQVISGNEVMCIDCWIKQQTTGKYGQLANDSTVDMNTRASLWDVLTATERKHKRR